MATPTPTVTTVTQASSINRDGSISKTFIVTFTVGNNGPFTINVPEADFKPDEVKKRMAEVADTIGKLQPGS